MKNADCCSIHYSGVSYLQSTSIWSIIISTYYILLTYAICIFNHHKYRQKGSQKLLVLYTLTQSVFKTWLLLDCHLIWGKYLLAIFRTLRSLASFRFSRLSVYYVMLSKFWHQDSRVILHMKELRWIEIVLQKTSCQKSEVLGVF